MSEKIAYKCEPYKAKWIRGEAYEFFLSHLIGRYQKVLATKTRIPFMGYEIMLWPLNRFSEFIAESTEELTAVSDPLPFDCFEKAFESLGYKVEDGD